MGEVIKRLESNGFGFTKSRIMPLEGERLREHYAHVADKPFFPEIESFMTRCPLMFLVVKGENAIERIRDLLGPTDSTQAAKGTIRGDLGTDIMQNIAHASDSKETAFVEIERFFGAGNS